MGPPSTTRRRWFQFRLWTLLLLMTVLSVGLAWGGIRYVRQQQAVQTIEELGGQVWYDYQGNPWKPPPTTTPPGPQWLRKLIGNDNFFATVEHVSLHRAKQLTDDKLACIRDLPRLKAVDLSETPITDAGLAHLQGLSQLMELDLTSCPSITDAGLVHLEGLPRLEYLFSADTQTTAVGRETLRRALPKLRTIP